MVAAMVPISININDTVKVKLTEVGLAHARRSNFTHTAEAVDAEGYSSWQLWVLMNVFGESLWCGGPIMFEQNSIRIDLRIA